MSYRSVVFMREGGRAEADNTFATAEDQTPERAMQKAAEAAYVKAGGEEPRYLDQVTWQPASGVVFVGGEPCGAVWRICP